MAALTATLPKSVRESPPACLKAPLCLRCCKCVLFPCFCLVSRGRRFRLQRPLGCVLEKCLPRIRPCQPSPSREAVFAIARENETFLSAMIMFVGRHDTPPDYGNHDGRRLPDDLPGHPRRSHARLHATRECCTMRRLSPAALAFF